MPIETKIEGDPASIRVAARWLQEDLHTAIDHCVTEIYLARGDSEWAWQGAAGAHFRDKMSTGGKKADGLAANVERAGRAFALFADDLQTAQAGMERALAIARNAGLMIDGTKILEPSVSPAPQTMPAGAAAVVQQAHVRKVEAYYQAADQANWSHGIVEAAKAAVRALTKDLVEKRLLHAADFVNEALLGGLYAAHMRILREQAKAYQADAKVALARYLSSPGGSPESRYWNSQVFKNLLDADEWEHRAKLAGRRVGSKIPIIGAGITAAGVGYDIQQGKPAGKAVISGVGGAVAAAWTGALVGGAIGSAIPIPVVGTLVGAGFGAAFGIGAGIGVEALVGAGYDQLPKGVRDGIENGLDAVDHGVADAGEAVGGGVKKVWDSIF